MRVPQACVRKSNPAYMGFGLRTQASFCVRRSLPRNPNSYVSFLASYNIFLFWILGFIFSSWALNSRSVMEVGGVFPNEKMRLGLLSPT